MIILLYLLLKKSIEDTYLGLVAFLILIAGLVVKGVGFYLMNKNGKVNNASIGLFFICGGKSLFYYVSSFL